MHNQDKKDSTHVFFIFDFTTFLISLDTPVQLEYYFAQIRIITRRVFRTNEITVRNVYFHFSNLSQQKIFSKFWESVSS